MTSPRRSSRAATEPAQFLRHRRSDQRAERPWAPFAYVNRRLRATVAALFAPVPLGPGATVLDYGCADRPYRDLVPEGVGYVGADIAGNLAADVTLGPDGSVPLPDASVDLVLSTQVLEHVPEPGLYLAECARVLRPGGSLLLTTHGVMYYHRDPEDYWRWTPAGLRRVAADHGFEIVELRGVLGLAPTAIQLFQDATWWRVPRLFRGAYTLVMQALVAATDRPYSDALRAENSWTIAIRATRP